ncbi:RHS repeat domain-containing protein [Hymenobacter sp. PAMC 26628]|uniref:RHS repeat domain-containing protein n=1 Tax=Hymenobacter sp. PAMC 26628 TaxID=1484118 RepID=UPI001F4453A9|nr:RHS repeat domain-containing protein [Hymenobacter sp. PAMC 26628]
MNDGVLDTQPDAYFYSIGNSAGSLVFSDSTHAFAVTERGLAITYDHGYVVVDKEGTTYLLGSTAASRDDTFAQTDGDGDQPPAQHYASSFHLNTIISANKQDTVRFFYAPEVIAHTGPLNETDFIANLVSPNTPRLSKSSSFSSEQTTQQRLQRIEWRNGVIQFGAATARRDLPNGAALDYIEVRDGQGTVVKRYDFAHDYFYTNSSLADTQPIAGQAYQEELLRLKLTHIGESGGDVHSPGYDFHYYEHRGIPARNSFAQDHWGFANLNNVNTLLPATSLTSGGVVAYPDGGNRDPDFPSALAGLLREVRYPTGGRTRLYYEAHDIAAAGFATTTRRESLRLTQADLVEGMVAKEYTFSVPRTAQVQFTLGASVTTVQGEGNLIIGVSGNVPLMECTTAPQPSRAGTAPSPIATCYSSLTTTLYPGQYTMYALGNIVPESGPFSGSVTAVLTEIVPTVARVVVGGARLKRLVDIAGTAGDSLVTEYGYTTGTDSSAASSGVLVTKPIYDFGYSVVTAQSTGELTFTVTPYTYLGLASAPHSGLGSTQGSHLGYQQVTVTQSKAGVANGATVYTYTTAHDFPDYGSGVLPQGSVGSNDYQRGLLTQQRTFDAAGHLLQKTTNQYTADGRAANRLKAFAVRAVRSVDPHVTFDARLKKLYPVYASGFYYLHDQWQYLKRSTTIKYAPADTTQQYTQQQTYFYGNPGHGLVTQTTTRDPATGEQYIHCLRYPLDYAINGTDQPSLGLLRLQQTHQLTPVVEETQWVKHPGAADSLLLQSQLHTYRLLGSSRSVEHQVHRLALAGPVASYAAPASTAGGWQADARYQVLQTYDSYGPSDNPLQITRQGDRATSFLWGYGHEKLIAASQNASFNQIAATSFEPDATGRWRYDSTAAGHRVPGGRTGRWAYRLNGAGGVSRNSLPAGDYELTCWLQGEAPLAFDGPSNNPAGAGLVIYLSQGSGFAPPQLIASAPGNWHQYRARFRLAGLGAVTLDSPQGGATPLLDELRLYPVGAQLTSYTHDPLGGMTSQTDPTGRILTYEYDGLSRLIRVRDEQGHLLSQQQYHYAGQ